MKLKRAYTMFIPFQVTPMVSKRLFFFGALLFLCFSGYGQDPISIGDVTQAETDAGSTVFTFTVSVDGGGNAA
ncbi:MAG: hypothetical protein COC08_04655, partial [Maribacter sp.]